MTQSNSPIGDLHGYQNLIEVLQHRVERCPEKTAFIFLEDGESVEQRITYRDLDRKARTIGSYLRSHAPQGERAVLLYLSGIDYIAAFYGCLYGGMVAVPAYPPDPRRAMRTLPRLQQIIADCQARFVLTTSILLPMSEAAFALAPELRDKHWVSTDDLSPQLADSWETPNSARDALAFLQYTSGSTGAPKGVMISNGNLLDHEASLIQVTQQPTDRTVVGWLPIYHDLGLMGMVIMPVCVGATCVFMSPMSFLQKPVRWLQALSKYRGWLSCGPNFSFGLCVSHIPQEDRKQLDLSDWQFAGCGAEPVRSDTMQQFIEAFAPCGFRPEALCPQYGLAEATLGVTSSLLQEPLQIQQLDTTAMAQGRVKLVETRADALRVVGCGSVMPGTKIEIVDPETLTRCAADQIGEIWVSGSGVSRGYWARKKETRKTFQARLADTNEGPFLRTGDLGYLVDDRLYIAARLKDLIIIRGVNYYPQDIEAVVEHCHPHLRPGCSTAFASEVHGEEQLVIAVEVERRQVVTPRPGVKERRKRSKRVRTARSSSRPYDRDEVFQAVRQAVTDAIEVIPYSIALLRVGTIPKTSSGKIQRRVCRSSYADGSLQIVAQWIYKPSAEEDDAITAEYQAELLRRRLLDLPETERYASLVHLVQEEVAKLLGLTDTEAVPRDQPFRLDSVMAVELRLKLSVRAKVELPPVKNHDNWQ